MADENPTTDKVDLRLLGRHVADIRLRVGSLEGRVGAVERDVKVLIVMAQNQDEAMKDMRAQLNEMVSVISTRFGALEDALLRIERRLEER